MAGEAEREEYLISNVVECVGTFMKVHHSAYLPVFEQSMLQLVMAMLQVRRSTQQASRGGGARRAARTSSPSDPCLTLPAAAAAAALSPPPPPPTAAAHTPAR